MNLSNKMVGDKEAAQAFAKLDGNLSGKKLEEIGRASCRERVSDYV